jgi:hypothetical protein
MAMPTSSAFSGPERRKKLVTYGRAGRLSNAQIFNDDAPELERARKQVGRLPGASVVAGSGAKNELHASRGGVREADSKLYDEFDVPDGDEPAPKAVARKAALQGAVKDGGEVQGPFDSEPRPRAIPAKKLSQKPPPKSVDDFDVFDVPSSGDERGARNHGKVKVAQPLRSKGNATRPKVSAQQANTLEKKQIGIVSSNGSHTTTTQPARIRTKTPVAATKLTSTVAAKHDAPALKLNPRATASAPQAAPKQKKAKAAPASSVTETVPTPPTEPNSDIAVFDVPLSDDDVPSQTPVRRKAPIARAKVPSKSSTSRAPLSPEPSVESDTSNVSHKRKRRGSASSSITVKQAETAQRKREASVPIQRKREASVPAQRKREASAPAQRKREASIPIPRKREASAAPRSRKHQKTENSLSPGHSANEAPRPNPVIVAQNPLTDKPNRTRVRTVSVISKPMMAKAQSSPVKLHGMLTMRSAAKPLPVQETPEAAMNEDETMYDVPDQATPRVQGTKSAMPGSVTPRQRDLFSNLLEDTSDITTPMPSISKLRVTERTPGSAFAALARSSSDIPQSLHTRKGRLLDMLKRAAPSVDEESESEEESEADATEISTMLAAARPHADQYAASQDIADAMEIDRDTQASSQTSRAPLPMEGTRTYAQQRSYLEEANLEDGLLNWDDDLDVDLPTRQGSVTESEDDSQQVTGLPELRRKGQLYKFEAETQAIIEDISGKTNTNISARRSAIIEFATQLADVNYVNQLLESAMTSSLLRAISATGDVIFDFAAAGAVIFILRTKPSYAVVEHIYQSDILSTLRKLLSSPMSSLDIHRISKERKTNMSGSARELVAEFRGLILKSLDWPEADVPKLSPQLLAIKVLEELVIGLRLPGNTEAIVDDGMISKVLDVASGSAQRLQSGKATAQDDLILETVFSALESLSISQDGQASWPDELLKRLADMMAAFFDTTRPSPHRLVIRLCMNLANNRPNACEIFAGQTFVTRLTSFIVESFKILDDATSRQPVARVRDDLVLALGAMMNLAEFSDQARLNVVSGGEELIGGLVRIFLEGSERAERVRCLLCIHLQV